MTDQPLAELEEQRARLFEQLAGIGGFPCPEASTPPTGAAGRQTVLVLRQAIPGTGPRLPVDPLGGAGKREAAS